MRLNVTTHVTSDDTSRRKMTSRTAIIAVMMTPVNGSNTFSMVLGYSFRHRAAQLHVYSVGGSGDGAADARRGAMLLLARLAALQTQVEGAKLRVACWWLERARLGRVKN